MCLYKRVYRELFFRVRIATSKSQAPAAGGGPACPPRGDHGGRGRLRASRGLRVSLLEARAI